MMYGWGDGGAWWMMGIGSVISLAVLVALVWLALAMSRRSVPGGVDDARAILAARYARGEIDADEYTQRLSVLGRDKKSG